MNEEMQSVVDSVSEIEMGQEKLTCGTKIENISNGNTFDKNVSSEGKSQY